MGPEEVFRKCPPFVRSTIQVPKFESIYYESLCEMLDLPVWSYENNLKAELEAGVSEMLSVKEDWQSIAMYVFTALDCIVREGFLSGHS